MSDLGPPLPSWFSPRSGQYKQQIINIPGLSNYSTVVNVIPVLAVISSSNPCQTRNSQENGRREKRGEFPQLLLKRRKKRYDTSTCISGRFVGHFLKSIYVLSVTLSNIFYKRVILWMQGLHQRTENRQVY